MFEFEWENTWKEYKEFALLPTILLYTDSDVYKYYGLIFQFLNIKIAVSVRKQWKSS